MDLANGTHDYHLKKPIMVHFAGKGEQEVTLLELHEPARAHVKYSAKLKQMVMKSMLEVGKNAENQDAVVEEIKSIHDTTDEEHEKESDDMQESVKFALMLSQEVDLGDFIETFITMILKNSKKQIIMCDGQVPIKDVHIDQISADDLEELALTYASFFLMPSVMKEK